MTRSTERRSARALDIIAFRLAHPFKKTFHCPVCTYRGPFKDLLVETGVRRHAACAACGALERHRLQHLVSGRVFEGIHARAKRMLHFAPEDFFRPVFSRMFGTYETADLAMPGVDHVVDLAALPFPDAAYDVVYASHVLEHVKQDRRALSEIRRILAPGGVAILPVPVIVPHTIEYPGPNPREAMHVRAPGPDYFDRLTPFFRKVELYSSGDFPEAHQLFVHEDRTAFPNEVAPLRVAMPGNKHADMVPVCWA